MYFFFVLFKFFLERLHFNFSQISLLLQTSDHFILIFYFVFELINVKEIIVQLFLHALVLFHHLGNHGHMILLLIFKSLLQFHKLLLQSWQIIGGGLIRALRRCSGILSNIDIQILNTVYVIDLRVARIHSLYLLSKIHNVIVFINFFVLFLFFTNFCQLFLKLTVLKL